MLKLKEFRNKNNYTQRYIAFKVGVSQQTIAKWEKGSATPSIPHLIRLAGVIGCNIEDLIIQ